jgi:hypothetical protein
VSPRLPFVALMGVALAGAVVVSQRDGPADRPAATDESLGVAPSAVEPGPGTWFCVGGTARPKGFADHTVIVGNAGDRPLTGHLTAVPGTIAHPTASSGDPADDDSPPAAPPTVGPEATRRFTVAPGEQMRFRLGDLVDAPLASAVVETGRGVAVVDHEVQGPHGTDRAPCSQHSAATWHFAWGATSRDAHEVLVLFNPFPNDVQVDGMFSTERGIRQPLRWQGLRVPARSVVGLDVGDDVTRRSEVAATLQVQGGELLVDRLQSFDGSAGVAGLDVAGGQPAARSHWVLVDGRVDKATAEQVVLYNPGTATADVDVDLAGVTTDGIAPEPFGVDVRPGRIEALDLQGDPRVPPGVGHALTITSRNGVPVVAEQVVSRKVAKKPRLVDARPAAADASDGWAFAGQTDGRIAVLDPGGRASADLDVTLLVDGERVVVPKLPATRLRPGHRTEITLPTTGGHSAPALVLLRATHPVVAQPIRN